MISLLLKVFFSTVTERIHGLGSARRVWILPGNNKLNIQSEYRKIGSFNQRVSACYLAMVQCHATFVGGGGGGAGDSFKINRKNFLRMRMSIGYMEPLVKLMVLSEQVEFATNAPIYNRLISTYRPNDINDNKL